MGSLFWPRSPKYWRKGDRLNKSKGCQQLSPKCSDTQVGFQTSQPIQWNTRDCPRKRPCTFQERKERHCLTPWGWHQSYKLVFHSPKLQLCQLNGPSLRGTLSWTLTWFLPIFTSGALSSEKKVWENVGSAKGIWERFFQNTAAKWTAWGWPPTTT